jgi:RNA polymerase sigma factor (sigma-70 family)
VSAVDGSAALLPEPADESDGALLRQMHDEEFRSFTEQTYHRVERILRSRWRDQDAVKDALQTAYLHGRVQWSKIRTYDAPIGWIIKTARNHLLKEYDRRQRETVMAPEDLPVRAPSTVTDTWEAREMVSAWVRQLPPRHAEVFQMAREGFSNDEIARMCGLADISVRSYKAAALRQLRQLAEEDGYRDADGAGGGHGSR